MSNKDKSWGGEIARINCDVTERVLTCCVTGDADRGEVLREVWEMGRKMFKSETKNFVVVTTHLAEGAYEKTTAEFLPDRYRDALTRAAHQCSDE